jgi:hypothetical protein
MDTYKPISITASVTLDRARHMGALLALNAAAGLTVTLPASSGSGDKFEFIVGTTVTSNSDIIKVANSTDIMIGNCIQSADSGSSVNGWETGATDDTITMNGTTTGGVKGDRITLIDAISGFWEVVMVGSATGTEATPFSATV